MSTRGQVRIQDSNPNADVYLYQHYDGYELPQIVQDALKRGKDRWNDTEYLARIVFSEMIRDSIESTTGYGIGTEQHGDIEVLVELLSDQRVIVSNGYNPLVKQGEWSFKEYCELELEKEIVR